MDRPARRAGSRRRWSPAAGALAPAAGRRPGGSPRELAFVRAALLCLDRVRVTELLVALNLLDRGDEQLKGGAHELGLIPRSRQPLRVAKRGQLELVQDLLAVGPGERTSLFIQT